MNNNHVFRSSLDPAQGQQHYFMPGLDGLRALAVLAVVLYHLWPQLLPTGMVGVDIFFVISGYLITALLLREGAYQGSMNIINFWLRRARRLLPAIFVLVITIAALSCFLEADARVGLSRQILGAFTFSSNWLYIAAGKDYFAQTSPELLTNFWSLALEEQFYIFWPVILVFIFMFISSWKNRALIPLILGLSSLLLAGILSLFPVTTSRIYYGTDSHLYGLMLGVLLAFLAPWSMYPPANKCLHSNQNYPQALLASLRTTLAWCCLLALPALMLSPLHHAPKLLLPWGLFLACLLTAGVIQGLFDDLHNPLAKLMRQLLSLKALVWLGQRSYGIYLWHWPLYVLTHYLPLQLSSPWRSPFVLLATLLLAGLSYRYIEEPIRRLGFKTALTSWVKSLRSSKPALGLTALVLLLAASLGTGLALNNAPQQTQAQEVVAAGSAAASTPSQQPEEQTKLAQQPGSISIIGDSVTLAASPAIQEALPTAHIDAQTSRTFSSYQQQIESQSDQGQLGQILIIALTTNSTLNQQEVTQTAQHLLNQQQRILIFVNGYAPEEFSWVQPSNQVLTNLAATDPQRIIIADWASAAAGHPTYFVSDGIHPQEQGQQAYALTLAAAVQEARNRLGLTEDQASQNTP